MMGKTGRQRTLILRDIEEVGKQLAEGDLDQATADRLIDRYRQELRSLESSNPPEMTDHTDEEPSRTASSGRRRAGTLVLIGGVVIVAITALLSVRPREDGFITGGPSAPVDLSEVTNDQMEAVIAANPDIPEISAMQLALADRYFEEGSFSEALPHYLDALEGTLDPLRRARGLARVGWMSYLSGNVNLALTYLQGAQAMDPGYTETNLFLGFLLLEQSDFEGAVEQLTPLLEDEVLPDDIRGAVEAAIRSAEESLGSEA
ncbi:MAG: hypothetical protein OXH10_00690 [bacterium]|nr:hypothetical protein [bacterium]